MDSIIQTIAVYAIPLIFAITLHEAAHGYVARMFGDDTATQAGRVTLNPVKHIDPVGTLLVPAVILLTSKLLGGAGLLFGWAKPVPVDFGRLHRPKRDMLWVAAAGPGINLVMAIIWALGLKLMLGAGVDERFFVAMAIAGVQVNLMLMALNLLPIPPLDGGRIVFSLLPHSLAWKYSKLEPYGMPILLVLLMTGMLGFLVRPMLMLGDAIVRLFL
ncbi:site-2 protease family protein [Pigmentiphaga sp.]|jgi:Zn-dependent proteases|uniref:site-2 protease family protein n=1 Tax=Pigmentiphaga sp. TaxID=1977564 RepID=UPI0025F788F2|nr:site-2 protease family protein [Pigmentiphaga sp.]MBX6318088.1 site-2 protease family protein [Pigmentiphaga sp.]